MIIVLFTVPFYHFLFSRYLVIVGRHFSSDILVPFPDWRNLYSRGHVQHHVGPQQNAGEILILLGRMVSLIDKHAIFKTPSLRIFLEHTNLSIIKISIKSSDLSMRHTIGPMQAGRHAGKSICHCD